MGKIDLSIVIPVYNMENYIEKCLDSLLDQKNMENFSYEILCIDDNSHDKSKEILKKYESKQIKVIFQEENNGQGYARNIGIKHAKGDYIGFVDSDDWVASNYIYEIAKAIKIRPKKIMFSFCKITKQGNFNVKLNMNGFHNTKYSHKFPAPWMKIYQKEIIKNIKFEKMIYEDLKFCIDEIISSKVDQVYYIDKPLYMYNQLRTNNTMNKINVEDMKKAFEHIDIKKLGQKERVLINEYIIERFVLYGILKHNIKLFAFFSKKIIQYNIFYYLKNIKYTSGIFYCIENKKGISKYRI